MSPADYAAITEHPEIFKPNITAVILIVIAAIICFLIIKRNR